MLSLHFRLAIITLVFSILLMNTARTQSIESRPNYIFPDSQPGAGIVSGSTDKEIVTEQGVEGEIIIHNTEAMWFKLQVSASPGASVRPLDLFAHFGYLPPYGSAIYTASFTSVDQNAVITAVYDKDAATINTAESLINLIPGAGALAGREKLTLLGDLSLIPAVIDASQEIMQIEPGSWSSFTYHAGRAGYYLGEAVLEDEVFALIGPAFAKTGIPITKETLAKFAYGYAIYQSLQNSIAVFVVLGFIQNDRPFIIFQPSLSTPLTGDIKGRIQIFNGAQRLQDVTITITNTRTTQSIRTDGNGNYSFYRFPAGKATITAQSPYGGATTEVVVESGKVIRAPDMSLTNLTIVLAIDSSGSMVWNDPNNLRKEGATLLVEALLPTDRISIVDFDSSARPVWPMSTVGDNRADIIRTINRFIDSNGGTNISDALRVSYGQIDSADFRSRVLTLLLTDGQQDPPSSYDPFWENAFQYRSWPVYTFGLSGSADAATLGRISTKTGGTFTPLMDPSQLVSLYNKLRIITSDSQFLLDSSYRLSQDETWVEEVTVPLLARTATFVTSWPGSRVDTTLITPSGFEITPDTISPYITHIKGEAFEMYRVTNPEAGVWQMKAFGVQLRTSGELVSLQVDADLRLKQLHLPLIRNNQISPQTNATPTKTPTVTPTHTTVPSATPSQTSTTTSTPTITPSVVPTSTPTQTSTSVPDALPEGSIAFVGGNDVAAGSNRTLHIRLTASEDTRWNAAAFTSNCTLTGLPTGFATGSLRTHLVSPVVYIPPSETGKSCTITGTVTTYGMVHVTTTISLSLQFTVAPQFTLGNIQPLANWPMDHLVYPQVGSQTYAGVPFMLLSGDKSVFQTRGLFVPSLPLEGVLQVNITRPKIVHVLLNGGYVEHSLQDVKVGEVVLTFDDGAKATYNIVAWQSVRETWGYVDDPAAFQLTSPPNGTTWRNVYQEDQLRGNALAKGFVDMVSFTLPDEFMAKRLVSITISDTSDDTPDGEKTSLIVMGVTVEAR